MVYLFAFCLCGVLLLPWISLFLPWWTPGAGFRIPLRWQRHSPARRCHARPAKSGVRNQPKPAWVVAQVIRLKALLPDAGCRRIANTFNRRYAHRHVSVSKSYVATVVRAHTYEITIARRKIKHRVPSPLPINQVWGLDLTGKQDAAGNVHAILGLIDHGSRRLLTLCLCPRRNALTLLGQVFLAMGKHGVPKAIRTDNDAVFTCRLFRWGLGLAGVKHQRSDPGCPWQNGRIERVFGTLKEPLDRLVVYSGAALSSLLGEFGFWYKHVRPHQHLGGATPMEVWCGIDPYLDRPKSVRWVSFWEGRLAGYWMRR